jgi:hypothetical protein
MLNTLMLHAAGMLGHAVFGHAACERHVLPCCVRSCCMQPVCFAMLYSVMLHATGKFCRAVFRPAACDRHVMPCCIWSCCMRPLCRNMLHVDSNLIRWDSFNIKWKKSSLRGRDRATHFPRGVRIYCIWCRFKLRKPGLMPHNCFGQRNNYVLLFGINFQKFSPHDICVYFYGCCARLIIFSTSLR